MESGAVGFWLKDAPADLGVPKNPENPFYNNLAYDPDESAWIDIGLAGYLESVQDSSAVEQMGKMKVPRLRNVDKRSSTSFVKSYGHNEYFKSLEDIIRFYASRGMIGGMSGGTMCGGLMFPEPEVNQNLATLNHLRRRDQAYIAAFLGLCPMAISSARKTCRGRLSFKFI